MNSISVLRERKKVTFADLVRRPNDKNVQKVLDRAVKKADKMQAEMLKRASKIKK